MSLKGDDADTGRDYFFTPAGKNTWSGKSDETPVADPTTAIARVNAISPVPGPTDPASINASVSGTYSSGVVIPRFVTCKSASASILTSDSVNVECRGRHEVEWGSLLNFSANGICVLIDGQTRVAAEVNACVPIGVDSVGFSVSGQCDEVFIQLRLGDITGVGAIMFDHTAEGLTPLQYDIQSINFISTSQTVIRYNDTVGTTETVFNIATAQRKIGGPVALAGTVIVDGIAGTLAVNANVLDAEYIAIIKTGAVLSLTAQVIAGKTKIETGGVAVYDTVGVIFGSLETVGTGSLQVRSTNIFGDVTNNGNMSIKADAVIGDITNNGSMFVNIANHIGVLTNNGTLNGWINGVPFGNTRQKPFEINELFAFSTSDQTPLGTDTPLQLEFGGAQGSVNDPIELKSNGAILIHKANQYKFITLIQYGRTGSGGASWLFFRLLVDDKQVSRSIFVKLDGTGDDLPLQLTRTLNLTAGQTVTFEVIRDSQGNDSGGLFVTTPTLGDWLAAPSASVRVSSESLIQSLNLIAVLPGNTGDFFSTPDSTAASITGDLDIQMRVSATDWTPATTESLLSKWDDPSDEKSYLVQLTNTGALRIFLSEDGVITLGPATSSVPVGFIGETLHWVRVTWDQSSGDVDFFTSEDNTDDPALVSWTPLGVTQTLSPTAIFDSTADVEVGSHNAGTINFDGTMSRASIFNGIGGVLAVDFNPQDYRSGSTFTALLTGETWTLNGNVSIEI